MQTAAHANTHVLVARLHGKRFYHRCRRHSCSGRVRRPLLCAACNIPSPAAVHVLSVPAMAHPPARRPAPGAPRLAASAQALLLTHLFRSVLPAQAQLFTHLFRSILPTQALLLTCLFRSVLPAQALLLTYLFRSVLPVQALLLTFLFRSVLPAQALLYTYLFRSVLPAQALLFTYLFHSVLPAQALLLTYLFRSVLPTQALLLPCPPACLCTGPITSPLEPSGAEEARDALAKALYSRTFDWWGAPLCICPALGFVCSLLGGSFIWQCVADDTQ